METRKEKVKFLKELAEGERSLSELHPPKVFTFVADHTRTSFFCEELKRNFAENELNIFKRKNDSSALIFTEYIIKKGSNENQ